MLMILINFILILFYIFRTMHLLLECTFLGTEIDRQAQCIAIFIDLLPSTLLVQKLHKVKKLHEVNLQRLLSKLKSYFWKFEYNF